MSWDRSSSGRGGATGLLGAAVTGVCGLVLTTVVVRVFGAEGAGILFTAIGLVTVAGAVCCLGADTGLVWALPRRTSGPTGDAARLLPLALLPTMALAVATAVGGLAAAGPIAMLLLGDEKHLALVRWAFVGVPVIVASTVLLAAVRATRDVGAYVGVQMVAVPLLRPALTGGLVGLGGGVVSGFAGWLVPAAAAAAAGALLIVRPLGLTGGASWRWTAADRRMFWGFALPRAASVVIDASTMWVGVMLTAALAGPSEAGVFAAVGRYALAGLLIMHGLRVAVAPQLSRLLGAGRRADATAVYRRTTGWIVVLSWPAYLLLAAFAPGWLQVFGDEFGAGVGPLTLLAAAMLVNVGVGLVQTVLLMSGNSRRHLAATVVGLSLNVAAAVLLIPRHGALGAAAAWSAGIVAENVMAAWFARRALGAPLFTRRLATIAAAAVTVTGAASAVGVAVAGRGPAGLAVTLAVLSVAGTALLADARVRVALREQGGRLRPAARAEEITT